MPEQINFPNAERLERQGFEQPESAPFERRQEVIRPTETVSQALPNFNNGQAARTGQQSVLARQQRLKEIEQVLEEDLADIYFQLPPNLQQQFKIQGEAAAKEINGLLETVKATANKVAEIIRNWLKIIPGVNTFFLEQEIKIKTDKLMAKYYNL